MELPAVADPADPLVQPTRARLFALLTDGRRPRGVEGLAEELGLHPNGVRLHLERMREAGLVERAKVSSGRGRPRWDWSVAPGAEPGGVAPTDYLHLARWLARLAEPSPQGLKRVERTGREIGRELAPRDAAKRPADAMLTALAALGFQPERREGHGQVLYCLGNCPYRDAVRENQEVVCTLHRGMARGLLDVLEPDSRLAGFVARDPYIAGCLIEVAPLGEPEELRRASLDAAR